MPAPNNLYRNLAERLLANSAIEGECWVWLGPKSTNGYGQINLYCREKKRTVTKRVHRVAYEVFIGPIPEGLELDHTCRNPYCIHPNHLEPVTGQENLRRKWARA